MVDDATDGPDPFVSFEAAGPEMSHWEREQTRKAIDFLHRLPHFEEVSARVRLHRNAAQPPRQMEVRGQVVFSLEEAIAPSGMSILRREGALSPFVLFRIGEEDAARRMQIDFMAVSDSGRLIAVGTSDAGSEETTVRVLDARTGEDRGDRSYDVRLGHLVWLPHDAGYLYMRGRGRKGVAPEDHIRDLSTALHRLGEAAEQDIEVVGSRARGKRIHAAYEYPYPALSPDGREVVVSVRHALDPDLAVFWKKRDALLEGTSEWERLYEAGDQVNAVAAGNGRVFVLRRMGDGQHGLEEVTLDARHTRRLLYCSERPLEDLILAGDRVYVVETEIATKHLVAVDIDAGGRASRVSLPAGTSVWPESVRADPSTHDLVVDLRAWTEPRSWWRLRAREEHMQPLVERTRMRATDVYPVRLLEAIARDGERIPLTVVGPAQSAEGAQAKPKFVWVAAYGCYGMVIGPNFTVARRVFLEYGGTYVFAHVRGGGEKGRGWHEQGRGKNKIKTLEDLVDSVAFLRSAGFGEGGGIFVSGGSAGGIPLGGLLAREPALVDAMYIDAGILNVTRMKGQSAIGALHDDEYGSGDTPEGARRLRALDAYANIGDGRPYPPVLLRAGLNDVRVPRWQSSKFAARLAQATGSGHPVLLRLTGGGHLSGTTPEEEAEIEAEIVSFALSHLAAQPSPRAQ
ncbi:MAG TPA: prolyl oligopeptidase family serine peptidase [Polyangiaceae bacterium]|nr:prolyl oligopeptidase family serine peptidase [Polyangiaceae bacterium]